MGLYSVFASSGLLEAATSSLLRTSASSMTAAKSQRVFSSDLGSAVLRLRAMTDLLSLRWFQFTLPGSRHFCEDVRRLPAFGILRLSQSNLDRDAVLDALVGA